MSRFNSIIIQLIGFSAVLMGWIIAGIEIYHIAHDVHKIEVTPFALSGIFMTFGAVAIQTGSVMKVVDFITSISKIGGKRKYDPPSGFYYNKKDKP